MHPLYALPFFALAACTTNDDQPVQADRMDGAANDVTMDAGPVTRGQSVKLADAPFTVREMGNFGEAWAADFMPGSDLLFMTDKKGAINFVNVATGKRGSVSGDLPKVDYGGQGGMGDIAFGPGWTAPMGQGGDLYLSWVEAGPDDTRGAVVGRGKLLCQDEESCRLTGLEVLWRQDKTEGRGHYSHRIHFSPDGQHMFVTSGDRQEQDPAQDVSNNLGTVLRLTLDGKAAPGNPWADKGGVTAQFYSMGHRNSLGLDFAPDGRLWQIEMGPKHGDELNLIEAGNNYGWPTRSYGDNYNGVKIPDHTANDGFAKPAAYWVPATSPASLLIYSGSLFSGWTGDALVPGLSGQELNVVSLDGNRATGMVSYDMGMRIREVVEGRDGAIYLIEDHNRGGNGTLMKLVPKG